MESLAKLKWKCRRGTKELDYLLEGYLTKNYQQSPVEEQDSFFELLNFPDSQLISFLLGSQLPASEKLAQLVKKIRQYTTI